LPSPTYGRFKLTEQPEIDAKWPLARLGIQEACLNGKYEK
jgi:hypothetical protein